MQNYLFVHFKEKRTPDGEQVYFAVSRDGFHWDSINKGNPVLWSMLGEKGVRDFTIARGTDGKFRIFATDLSLSYEMRPTYKDNWRNVQLNGSHCLMMWESDDLLHWSQEKAIEIGAADGGCVWAPDVIQDPDNGDFILHWSSPNLDKDMTMSIYYCRTKDFETFSKPELLYENPYGGTIDSCMVYENGYFYLWVKNMVNPCGVVMLKSDKISGPFERIYEFDKEMETLVGGAAAYEAPTAIKLEDGSYNLFLDFFGVKGAGQGYVPFHCDDISTGKFIRSDKDFSYPYGFKHGTILTITPEEYDKVVAFDYEAESYNR